MVDYKAGSLRVHKNTVGVLTNDPAFEWHLENLDNYVGLSDRSKHNCLRRLLILVTDGQLPGFRRLHPKSGRSLRCRAVQQYSTLG